VSTNGTLLGFRSLGHGEASLAGVFTDATMGNPAGVLGYPWYEASALDELDDINPAATADNFLMVVGDWRKFIIVDRVGLTVEFIPHLFATANNRPSGQRGWYAYWRSGSDSVADGHFRMLSVPTAA
jgi:HK97 family phage major capsid protein